MEATETTPNLTKQTTDAATRVLLVDDKEDHYVMTRHLFSQAKRGRYQLDWVPTYDQALAEIAENRHDVYLIDYHLGLHSGVEVIYSARRNGCRAPMILFTAGTDPNSDMEALTAGATDYLTKGKTDIILLERTIHYAIEHTRQLEALHNSEAFTQTIISNAGEGLIVYDADLNCTVWNQFMEETTALPADAVIGPLQSDLFMQLFQCDPAHLMGQVLAGETVHLPDVYFYIPATGRSGWATSNFRPLVESSGSTAGVVVAFHDTTERKFAEDALRDSEERLRLAVDSAEIGTADWDLETDQVTYGGHFARLFGMDPQSTTTTYEGLFRHVCTEDEAMVRKALARAVADGGHYRIEFRVQFADGTLRWVGVQGQAYFDETGRPVRMGGVAQDITERKLIEDERAELLLREQEARRILEEANEMKMRFVAMVSHELRTPLTSIKGFTSTLLEPDVNWGIEQYHEFIGIIDQESDKLTDLVAQLMDISRMQAGALKIQERPYRLDEIVTGSMPQLESATRAHSLNIAVPDDLPVVMVDRRRVEQVIVNLVENAAKYSSPGTKIQLRAKATPERLVQIDVEDQGQGIPLEQRDRVFEAFHRISTSEDQKGAGLGLAICKGLVEAHGGRIWISDKEGPGTLISFTLQPA